MIPNWIFTGAGALMLASIAGFFSITGLGALYAASFIPVVIMAIGIEYGKIAATFWIHSNYKKVWSGWIVGAVFLILVAMGITSGGVFGFLSKGHLDQATPLADDALKIERIDSSINRDKRLIKSAERQLDQLDKVVDTLIKFDKISNKGGARDVRNKQKVERDELAKTINEANARIDTALNTRLNLSQAVNTVEAKLGPVKFLAELFGADPNNTVRYFTLAIVLLLDPFAIYLVIMTGIGYDRWRERKEPEIEVREVIKEVIKEVEVPVEKIVEKLVEVPVEKETVNVVSEVVREEIPLTMETLTEFLENQEIQDELVKHPELIDEVESLIQRAKDRDESAAPTTTGWVREKGQPMEFSHKKD